MHNPVNERHHSQVFVKIDFRCISVHRIRPRRTKQELHFPLLIQCTSLKQEDDGNWLKNLFQNITYVSPHQMYRDSQSYQNIQTIFPTTQLTNVISNNTAHQRKTKKQDISSIDEYLVLFCFLKEFAQNINPAHGFESQTELRNISVEFIILKNHSINLMSEMNMAETN